MLRHRFQLILLSTLVASAVVAEDSPVLTSLGTPATGGSLGPSLVVIEDEVWLSWLEPDSEFGEQMAFRASRLDRGEPSHRWTDPVTIDRGDDFWPNWADLSAMAPAPGGGLLAHRLRSMGEGTYDYGIEVLRSRDGREWQRLGWLHDDGVSAEHGFVSWIPEENGTRAIWLDGREMPDGEPMTLRTALITADGIVGRQRLDARVCECCATDAVATPGGALVVYRDRSDAEIRDIWLVRRDEEVWSEPRPVAVDGWEIAGCPVNGPAVAASGQRAWVAWFTAADGQPRVRLARSLDAGATFEEPSTVDDRRPLGRVEVVAGRDGDAWVLWVRRTQDGASLQLAHVDADGGVAESRSLMEISPSRRSGFPRAVRVGDTMILAWTEVADGQTRVRTGLVDLY